MILNVLRFICKRGRIIVLISVQYILEDTHSVLSIVSLGLLICNRCRIVILRVSNALIYNGVELRACVV